MENLTELLTKLAEKLGTTTEYLCTVLMKQATIEAYYAMISIGLFILMLIPFYKYVRWFSKNYKEIYENDNEILHGGITVVIGIIVIIWFIGSVCDIHTIMTALNNPEYWALKQVLKSIR
jgi:hypothetical protein